MERSKFILKQEQIQKRIKPKPTITVKEGVVNPILILAQARNELIKHGEVDRAREMVDLFRKFQKTSYMTPLELIENYCSIRIEL